MPSIQNYKRTTNTFQAFNNNQKALHPTHHQQPKLQQQYQHQHNTHHQQRSHQNVAIQQQQSNAPSKSHAQLMLNSSSTHKQLSSQHMNKPSNDENKAMIQTATTRETMMNINVERNYVRRGNFYGPVFDVDHLATFTVGSKLGVLKAEDGMRKLRIMEKSQGIWTMECQIMLDANYLVVYDKKNGQEVEVFPLELVCDPTSVVSDDKKDIYNNILLFTVIEDYRKKSAQINSGAPTNGPTVTPTEMHIFQCIRVHSAEIVDEIYKIKDARLSQSQHNHQQLQQSQQQQIHQHNNHPHMGEINGRKQLEPDSYRKLVIPSSSAQYDYNNNRQRAAVSPPVVKSAAKYYVDQTTLKIEQEVQVLNHCFDDIEKFVTRLQTTLESIRELDKRQKHRKSKKKQMGDGMLTMRSQLPQAHNFVDIFQKFKCCFNMLAKLKAHVHDPNAPELVHFLFTPLALIANTTREPPFQGLSKTVWQPLLTKEAKDLLLNCLTSKEQDLWISLGDAWTVTREEVRQQPHLYSNIDIQPYTPVFYDGWTPNTNPSDETTDLAALAMSTAAQLQLNGLKYNQIQQQPQVVLPIQKSRSEAVAEPSVSRPTRNESNTRNPPNQIHSTNHHTNNNNGASGSSSGHNPSTTIRNYDEMKKWAIDLAYRGAKVYEVVHDRQANNEKELTIKSGELLEVLDDKRNWWKLRNFYGNIGHAPVTILRPFEISSNVHNNHQANNSNNSSNSSSGNDRLVLSSSSSSSVSCASTTSDTATATAPAMATGTTTTIHITTPTPFTAVYNNGNSVCAEIGRFHQHQHQINNNKTTALLSPLLGNDNSTTMNTNSILNNLANHESTFADNNLNIDNNSSYGQNLIPSQLLSKSNNSNSLSNYTSSMSSFTPEMKLNDSRRNETKTIITPPFTPNSSASSSSASSSASSNRSMSSIYNNKYQNNLIANVNSINVILDKNALDSESNTASSNSGKNWNLDSSEKHEQDIEPIRDLLQGELAKKMNKEKQQAYLKLSKPAAVIHVNITNKSSTEEIKKFLISKDFSNKVVLMFGELNGSQLFSLTRSDFEKFCGKEEGTRLDSQIKLQKSLCGYKEETSELASILKKRKEKLDVKE